MKDVSPKSVFILTQRGVVKWSGRVVRVRSMSRGGPPGSWDSVLVLKLPLKAELLNHVDPTSP